jgi:hypothetical protein
MRCHSLIILAAALAGCASPPPVPRAEAVSVPIAVPCVSEIPAAPDYASKGVRHQADDGTYIVILTRDYLRARDHADDLRGLLEACRGAVR